MRYVGLLLTVLAGVGLGLYFAHRLAVQVQFLNRLERLLEALERRMTYTARPVAVLWKELANGGAYGDFRLLHDTADRLDAEPFAEAFYAAVQGAVTRGEVTPENARLLYELGQDSGRTDMAGQQGLLSAYRDQIHQAEEEARREADNKGRIYRMMGLAGGVSLALLLL